MPKREAWGNTTVSRVKSLSLHVERQHGRAEADAFVTKLQLERDYLDDETRPLPSRQWHAALVEFTSRWNREEIAKTADGIVYPDNLGVWTRVLRGAQHVAEAYRQLDQLGGDDVLTDRWRTVEILPGEWCGAVPATSEQLEGDGLLALARCAELSAVPILFGLPPAEVEHVKTVTDETRGDELLFRARWSEPTHLPILGGGVVGGVVPLALVASRWVEFPVGAIAAILGAGVGAGVGFGAYFEQRRRMQSTQQLMRIQALERAATLREARERGSVVFGEGTVVAGSYRLGPKLGAGASGAIYEATRLSDGKTVAIKLLRTAVAHDHLAADRLRREAAALGLAWHPNVVEVYDEGHLPDGTSYLVIERLYGESLEKRLRRGPLPPTALLPVALQVCDALGAVHAAGVIHRDLKPSNIFLAGAPPDTELDSLVEHVPSSPSLPSGERVKLLDFGVARVEWAETRLTNMGAALGTPGYMSPEQEQGQEIDVRSDLFSFGAVLYECLTGQQPPTRSSDLWARAEPGSDEPLSGVQKALETIPHQWRKIIDRALAPLPRDRYDDARAMKSALKKLMPVETAPESRSEKRA